VWIDSISEESCWKCAEKRDLRPRPTLMQLVFPAAAAGQPQLRHSPMKTVQLSEVLAETVHVCAERHGLRLLKALMPLEFLAAAVLRRRPKHLQRCLHMEVLQAGRELPENLEQPCLSEAASYS
jgi:hypothetical protein